MIVEAVMLMISCVLFIQMGLSEAIQDKLHFHSVVISCQKCMSFWCVLLFLLLNRQGFVFSIAASFVLSYAALWLSLLYDFLAALYNKFYERITKTYDAAESPDESEASDTDAVS